MGIRHMAMPSSACLVCRFDGVSGLMRGAGTREGGAVFDGIRSPECDTGQRKKDFGRRSVAQESGVVRF